MKKLIICVLCFASTHAFSQFRLGVEGSFSSLNFWQSDGFGGLPARYQTWAMNGFSGGLVAEYDLGYSGLVLQPAIVYAENGSHVQNVQGFVNPPNAIIGLSNTSLKVYSVRVPINLIYKYAINDRLRVFGGAGPYVAKNISGTEKGYYEGYYTNQMNSDGSYVTFSNTIDNKAKFNNNPSSATQGVTNITSFDFGGDIVIGASYKKFDLSINYSRGFSRIYHTTYVNAGNTFWNFTLAYTIFGHYRKPKL
jgi:hypothetical protein